VDEISVTLARDPRRVVSHNDVNPGNILWDGAHAWLVDWEVTGLGHPYYDLATLALFLSHAGAPKAGARGHVTSFARITNVLSTAEGVWMAYPAATLPLAAHEASLQVGPTGEFQFD
jgi:aminoglycoside phosphotransferase (APT) family kinase protein